MRAHVPYIHQESRVESCSLRHPSIVQSTVTAIRAHVIDSGAHVQLRPAGIKIVWLARPSHLIAGALRAGRDGLAAVTISSHLFSTNQMLLAGIRANSIHSLLSHAYYALQWNLISQSARPGVDILSRFLNV